MWAVPRPEGAHQRPGKQQGQKQTCGQCVITGLPVAWLSLWLAFVNFLLTFWALLIQRYPIIFQVIYFMLSLKAKNPEKYRMKRHRTYIRYNWGSKAVGLCDVTQYFLLTVILKKHLITQVSKTVPILREKPRDTETTDLSLSLSTHVLQSWYKGEAAKAH